MPHYTLEQALQSARAIKTSLPSDVKIYIFGSTLLGIGHDIDIIIEVSPELFESFKDACQLSGLHHSVRALEDPYNPFWIYFSPTAIRAERALQLFETSLQKISKLTRASFDPKSIDIICLPVGWNEEPLISTLQAEIPEHLDKKFMQKLSETALLVD